MTQKYGRTFHLPQSPGATSDDKVMDSIAALESGTLIITEKMDGENTTIHAGGCHARSPDSRYHPSRDWVKAFAAGISSQLAPDERIVGENVFAAHAITYDALPSYFLGFAWIIGTKVQSWEATLAHFATLGIVPVPVLYQGPYHPALFDKMADSLDPQTQEGFVVRVADGFDTADMPSKMGKYVRANHVQTDIHWTKSEMIPNKLR